MRFIYRLFFLAVLVMTGNTMSMAAVYYGIDVAGVSVTSDNASNVTGGGISGKVYFKPSENTLYLEDASIRSTAPQGIKCYKEGVKIKVVGTSSVTTTGTNSYGIQITAGYTLTITGADRYSKLEVYGAGGAGIMVEARATCVISTLQMSSKGKYGLMGEQGNSERVILRDDARLTTHGYTATVMKMFDVEAEVLSPVDATFVKALHTFTTDGSTPTTATLELGAPTPYNFKVADVEVNSYNCHLIQSTYIQGVVQYDDETKMLTLNNATINVSTGRAGIDVKSGKDMTILLLGNNRIVGKLAESAGYGIISNSTLVVTKNQYNTGTLTISGVTFGIWLDKAYSYLVLGGQSASKEAFAPIIDITATASAISGVKTAQLDFHYATLIAKSQVYSPIHDLKRVNLGGCEFTLPKGAYYDTNKLDVRTTANPDNLVTSIKIEPSASSTFLLGDVNNDGAVNTTDVTALYNVIFGTDTTTPWSVCNINGDSGINTTDVTALYNIIFGTAK